MLKFLTPLLLSLLIISCTPSTAEVEEKEEEQDIVASEMAEFKINNESSYILEDLEIRILAFNSLDDFLNQRIDTLTFFQSELNPGNISNGFEVPDSSVRVEIDYVNSNIEKELTSQFDVFDVEDPNTEPRFIEYNKLSGSYTLRLFDKYLYSYNAFEKNSETTDSIWVRVVNKTNAEINDFELVLDQERPADPNDAASRAQVEVARYDLGSLDIGEFSDYVYTELLFEEPRSFYFNAREQEANVINYDFEGYFYADSEELSSGYYTLNVIEDRFFLTADREISKD